MRSFGFETTPTLPLSLVLLLLSVTRLASCAPFVRHIDDVVALELEDVNPPHPPPVFESKPTNTPETPLLLLPIPTHTISTPAADPAPSSRRYTYTPPPTTAVIDTSEPVRRFPFPGFLAKSIDMLHVHQDSNSETKVNDENTVSTSLRNDAPNARASGWKGSRIPPSRGSPRITFGFPTSSSSTGSSSLVLSPAHEATVVAASPAVEAGLSQSPLVASPQKNAEPEALPHPSPPTTPTAQVLEPDVKRTTGSGSKTSGTTIPTILEKLRCLLTHGREKKIEDDSNEGFEVLARLIDDIMWCT